jgi:TetR/AcrR family transcriptional regulator, fatty acid metabolism regulator protein
MALNTKRTILAMAEKIMFDKGFANATISEIAAAVGVADSVIYYYFRNKEELLFAIIEYKLKEFMELLSRQLEGILDPISRLRKLIWCYLDYCDNNLGYTSLLMYDCLRNRNFFKHHAYQELRKYAAIILEILNDGVEKQLFQKDLDLRIIREMIIGLLNFENLDWLLTDEIERVALDLDDIMNLLLSLLSAKTDPAKKESSKSHKILLAAQEIFSAKSYQAASISEIAKKAAVSEATIYKYYKSKEALVSSIADTYFVELIANLNDLLVPESPLRRLRSVLLFHSLDMWTKPDRMKIFINQVFYNLHFRDTHHVFFNEYAKIIYPILDEGKQMGQFRKDINNRVYRNLVWGSLGSLQLRWLRKEEDITTGKLSQVILTVEYLLKSVASEAFVHHIQ